MNNSKNPYIILGLDPNKEYTDDDIKKAYHKNVLKYHPDKNKNNDAAEKFIEIHTAYEILSSDKNKIKYDSFDIEQKNEFYNIIKNSISSKYPNFNNYLDFFTNLFYNSENDFKDEILNNDFNTIYSSFIKKLPTAVSKFSQQLQSLKNNYVNQCNLENIQSQIIKDDTDKIDQELDLDIISSITCNLKDKINNKYRKILVKRDTRDDIILYVPLRKNKMIFIGDGEIFNDKFGDIIINIHCNDEKDKIKIIDNKHILYKINIDVYDYLFGGYKEIIIGDIIINFNLIPLSLDFIFINNKGIPDDNNNFGNLIISPYLNDYSNLKNDIMLLCKN